MDCSLMGYDFWDTLESAKVLHSRKSVARKAHVCSECGREIPVGEFYRNEAVLFEGKVATYKTCTDCESLRPLFDVWCFGDLWGLFHEEVVRYEGEGMLDLLSILTPRAREEAIQIIQEVWDDLGC